MLRNGEQLLLAVVIPVIVLVGGVAGAERLDLDLAHPAVDVFTPGVLALAVMSTAFTSLAIATGFERRYGVIKRLGSSPLPRSGLLAGKVAARCCSSRSLQVVVISAVGARSSAGTPTPGVARRVPRPASLGTAAFASLGLLRRRRAARRGHARRGQPGLPAADGRRRGGAARVGVRRLRRRRPRGCRRARSASAMRDALHRRRDRLARPRRPRSSGPSSAPS